MAVPGADRLQLTPDSTVYSSSINLLSHPSTLFCLLVSSPSLFLLLHLFVPSSSLPHLLIQFISPITDTHKYHNLPYMAFSSFKLPLGVCVCLCVYVYKWEGAERCSMSPSSLIWRACSPLWCSKRKIAFNCSTLELAWMRHLKDSYRNLVDT